jgi:hypothetical protein
MVVSLLAAGCGSKRDTATPVDAGPPTTLKPGGPSLTTAQASKLARILLKNHEAEGADVDATVRFGSAATFHLLGQVDWKDGQGRVVMSTTRSDKVAVADQTIAWGGSSVYLSVTGLTETLAAQGHPGITFLERPVSIKTNPLDQVITLIGSFSSARAENPLLLRQNDTSFEGTGQVAGRTVEKLRFGRSVYSVADDGFAYRIDTTFVSIQGPIVVTFDHHGPKIIPPIVPGGVAPLQTYGAVYDSLLAST